MGTDVHRLLGGSGFRLGGVDIPCEFAVHAVSDGDVLLHALVDALLGARALGDIGERYPESKVAPGQDSRLFLTETLELPALKRARIINVDCVIELERPRLSFFKERIRDNLAQLLGVALDRVNVKAKTAEGFDAVGQGLAIAARVVVLLELFQE